MNLDDIVYGNPTQEQMAYLNSKSYLDVLLPELTLFKFPKNSSEATKQELNQVVESVNALLDEDNYDQFYKRYKKFDANLKKFFIQSLVSDGEDEAEVTTLIENIHEDTKPLLLKLKFHFQRPRPNQLAYYYKLKLFPFESKSANSPSFPSGHAYQAKIFAEVLGNKYPNTYAFMQSVFHDICYSRVHLGLHFQSDVDTAIFCAESVLANKDFKRKYKL